MQLGYPQLIYNIVITFTYIYLIALCVLSIKYNCFEWLGLLNTTYIRIGFSAPVCISYNWFKLQGLATMIYTATCTSHMVVL